ncbi:histidine kinase N-terminal domain-containing protein [Bacillus sp. CGMCC 1.16541]|uniref:histidine kinase N-terminal domain-containing protein n=1 Tax=Bacillus sp. CGMCC 1.16541 TaxID=2185143 RepID=UPI000D72FEC8|nr:histidine kinase N-terminal domain-containing protein [Bacillus sp. CGMCC 1.16541]
MISSSEKLTQFLDWNTSHFLRFWRENIYLSKNDLFADEVMNNGVAMYELVRKHIHSPLTEVEIMNLAFKVAKERVKANINIGDFVYNVNLGRTIIIKHITQSGLSIEELQPVVDEINSLFDRFSFHAVTRYTELKDQEIQEKNQFISQTHQDRLSLLGQMSSSFVHEFRNPLTAVMGFIKLLKDENPDLRYIDIIDYELDQLKYRITQFLHTSKQQIVDKGAEEVSFSKLFQEILDFIYPTMVDDYVDVVTNIEEECKTIANKEELKQVFINLLLNSIDALRQKEKPRTISITAKEHEDAIDLELTNNGPQIPSDKINVIFEPFYTTKELGTGIGLYVCKQIIEKHGGTITCSSDKKRTTFHIRLPKPAEVK